MAAALPPDALWAALDTHLRDNKMQLQQVPMCVCVCGGRVEIVRV